MAGENNEIRIQNEPWSFGVGVLIKCGDYVVTPKNCIFIEQEPNIVTDPTLHLGANEAQQLMDDLWQCGYRPSEGSGSAGSLKATEKHLSDMRDIAFHSLNITRRQ